jgi:hypothetical protein
MPLSSTEVETTGWPEAIEACFERGWTDGLPVVPATAVRVQQFLAAAGRKPDEVLLTARRRAFRHLAGGTVADLLLRGAGPQPGRPTRRVVAAPALRLPCRS